MKKRFPKIYRFFTDTPYLLRKNKVFAAGVLSLLLCIPIAFIGPDLYKNLGEKQRIENERKKIIGQIQFWQKIVEDYKGYRDGYFQLAALEYRLNNRDRAKVYIEKTLDLDPNFEEGRKLEKILEAR